MTKDRRPLIGINADYYTPAKAKSPYTVVHSGYYECLLTAGALPVILPPLTKEADLAPILDTLDALHLRYPKTSAKRRKELSAIRKQLAKDDDTSN